MAKLTFVLPVRGGSGGAHSVMQEVTALRNLGVDATVLVNQQNIETFRDTYDRYAWIKDGVVAFNGPKELGAIAKSSDIVVATTNTSVHSIAEAIAETKGQFRTAYYVQDYEPLFYDPSTVDYQIALASFALLPNCTYFAKTNWLCDIVKAAHGHDVKLVVPSIDHGIYFPSKDRTGRETAERTVCAMVRPDTPRRAPTRTIEIVSKIAAGQFGKVSTKIFGADLEEMEEGGFHIPEGIEVLGKLKQPQVASLLQQADFFLDLSDYQAFGRTAAEAMACGCISVAPDLGGTHDFITDGVNGFLVDTADKAAIERVLKRLFSMSDAELVQMRLAGLETVSRFTPVRAAISELRALST